MQVSISKGLAGGCVSAPPSKSMAHRLLICAALSKGESVIHGISSCEDVSATLDCLRVLGAEWSREGETVRVRGIDVRRAAPQEPLPCRESGSTLRFFLPLTLLSGNPATLVGAPSLMQRPMSVYAELCRELGLRYEPNGCAITVQGPLPAGEYRVVGNVSSQFISGLLFALPLAGADSVIRITPPVESRSYLNLTVDALREFGVEIVWQDEHTLAIRGNQTYRAHETTVEGDYSNSAFLDALGVLGGEVTVSGLRPDSLQGDRVYRHYFNMLCQGTPTIHIGDCPDLGPILFSIAAAKHGGIFNGTRRLRIKESDRAAAMAQELQKFGVSVSVHEDTVVVYPVDFHAPDVPLLGYNDHRIVMSLAVLLTLTGGTIEGAEAIDKSYPDFFERLAELGVEVMTHE